MLKCGFLVYFNTSDIFTDSLHYHLGKVSNELRK